MKRKNKDWSPWNLLWMLIPISMIMTPIYVLGGWSEVLFVLKAIVTVIASAALAGLFLWIMIYSTKKATGMS